jgi:hypothetical protein
MNIIENFQKVFLVIIENDNQVVFDVRSSWLVFLFMGIQRLAFVLDQISTYVGPMGNKISFQDFKISYFKAFISWTIVSPVVSEFELYFAAALLGLLHLLAFLAYFSLSCINLYQKLPYFPSGPLKLTYSILNAYYSMLNHILLYPSMLVFFKCLARSHFQVSLALRVLAILSLITLLINAAFSGLVLQNAEFPTRNYLKKR